MISAKSKQFKHQEWTIADNLYKKEVLYVRKCISENVETFDALILKVSGNQFQCEVPTRFPQSSKLKSGIDLYIKNLKKFDSLEQSVMWVDINLIKDLKSEVEKPFIFYWY